MEAGIRRVAVYELWSDGNSFLKLNRKIQHQMWMGVAHHTWWNEVAGRCLSCAQMCILCIPRWLGSSGFSIHLCFLCTEESCTSECESVLHSRCSLVYQLCWKEFTSQNKCYIKNECIGNLHLLSFLSLISLAKDSSILLILSKKGLLISMNFLFFCSLIHLVCFYLYHFHLLVTLSLIWSPFSSLLRWRFRSPIIDHFYFLI